MLDFASIRGLLGPIILVLAGIMTVPSVVALATDSVDLWPFVGCLALTLLVGASLTFWRRQAGISLRLRDMFVLTNLAWFSVSFFGALPFLFSRRQLGFTDSFFESVSAVTTTGATVLSGLDSMPADLLLWRSLLQWLGGVGIIALGAAILPSLRVGGMRLFKTESSEWTQKALPHTRSVIGLLSISYLAISVLCTVMYLLAGMDLFDAVNHAMTTVATGGFSTHDASMGFFNSSLLYWVSTTFMAMSGIPFMLYLRALRGDRSAIFDDEQVRGYLSMLCAVIVIMALWLIVSGQADSFTAVTAAAFNVTSIMTTTGYASEDYTEWGAVAVCVFFFLTFTGACSGSTCGGIKVFRFQVAYRLLAGTFERLIHPSAVFNRHFNSERISEETVASVMAFSLAFACSVAVLTICVAATGENLDTSISAAATAMANVGPGLGDKIGPAGNFAGMTDVAKWLLAGGMLLGRLEIFTLLILFTHSFWRG